MPTGGLSPRAAALIRRHERHIRGRYELRHFLDVKRESGPDAPPLLYALANPASLPAIVGGILADKTERFRRSAASAPVALGGTGGLRYLLSPPGSPG